MCKEWKNWERLEFVGAGILENFQKIDAPPGGTGLAARRQCRDSESMWLQGESYPTEEDWNARRLTARGVPPGNTCTNRGIRGVRRLAVSVPRQAVWRPNASGDTVMRVGLLALECVIYKV
ncbi:hypothetical protein DEO72_LG8g2416 [Vigna unguiculata]|uniref:Uncharacterized protein n=1 Tax=Vigna unguiculata TaxID=3917 RepID=A0A4D6MS91_VIGUN|nr:hypothetical protein DEO72_LG8g2416 [Vigna unguiculata]